MREPTYAEKKQAELEAAVPGWKFWYTPAAPGYSKWSTMPFGATTSIVSHEDPEVLLELVREYMEDLGAHIEMTARELSETEPIFIGRVGMLRKRLDALRELEKNTKEPVESSHEDHSDCR